MKIGFDIDGTLERFPTLYSLLIKFLKIFGTQIFIITGRSRLDGIGLTNFQMQKWEIPSDHIFLREDYQGFLKPNDYKCNIDKQIGISKARLCKKLGVTLMVDDMEEVTSACKSEGVRCLKV